MRTVSDLVNRKKHLPVGELEGEFLVLESMIADTRKALTSFALSGIRDGGHEGLVFWAGRELARTRLLCSVVIPAADHRSSGVFLSEQVFGAAARAARARGVALLVQVHSHPGHDVRHSDGDDDLITMPYDGMLSIVVPDYGVGFSSLVDAGVHQFQNGRWVSCTVDSVCSKIKIVPTEVDLR